MKKLILVKLGGSLITDKSRPFTSRDSVIRRLGREIKKAKRTDIIIGHGQGSFAHIPAARYQTQLGIINKKSVMGMAEVSEMAKRPNTILTQTFLKIGLPVISFSPMSFIYTKETKPVHLLIDHIERALEMEMLPVIYGDVIFDDAKRGFCIYSGEVTLDLLAEKLAKKRHILKIVMAGDTNGVYDSDKKTIPEISSSSFLKVKNAIRGSGSTDVTGGMIHKVEKSLELASKLGIITQIINGNISGELERALSDKKVDGTVIRS